MKILCITPIKHIKNVFERLTEIGELLYEPVADKQTTRKRLLMTNAEVIYTNPNKQQFVIDEEVLKDTNVNVIATASTGLNHIDMKYCEKNNIKLLSLTKEYNTIEKISSTAEHAFALMMSVIRKIPDAHNEAMLGNWDYTKFIGRQISDLIVGIVGYGRLGKMMVKYCSAFGAKVFIYDPYVDVKPLLLHNAFTVNSLEELATYSDVISLHVHVTDETKYMIDKKVLDLMKKGSYIINTSRGEIVDEKAIIEVLETGRLNGYATDVIENEFDDVNKSELLNKARWSDLNIVVTPHIGGMTREAQIIAYGRVVDMLKGYLNG